MIGSYKRNDMNECWWNCLCYWRLVLGKSHLFLFVYFMRILTCAGVYMEAEYLKGWNVSVLIVLAPNSPFCMLYRKMYPFKYFAAGTMLRFVSAIEGTLQKERVQYILSVGSIGSCGVNTFASDWHLPFIVTSQQQPASNSVDFWMEATQWNTSLPLKSFFCITL